MNTPPAVKAIGYRWFISNAFNCIQKYRARSLPMPCKADGPASSHSQSSAYHLCVLVFPSECGEWPSNVKARKDGLAILQYLYMGQIILTYTCPCDNTTYYYHHCYHHHHHHHHHRRRRRRRRHYYYYYHYYYYNYHHYHYYQYYYHNFIIISLSLLYSIIILTNIIIIVTIITITHHYLDIKKDTQ